MSRDHYNILKIYPSPIRFFLCVDAVTTAPTCCYRDINYLTSLFWSELGDIFSLKYTAKWKTVGQRSNHTHNLNRKSINNWKETSFSISLGYRYCFLIFITFTSFLFLFLLYQLPPSLFSLFFFLPGLHGTPFSVPSSKQFHFTITVYGSKATTYFDWW